MTHAPRRFSYMLHFMLDILHHHLPSSNAHSCQSSPRSQPLLCYTVYFLQGHCRPVVFNAVVGMTISHWLSNYVSFCFQSEYILEKELYVIAFFSDPSPNCLCCSKKAVENYSSPYIDGNF